MVRVQHVLDSWKAVRQDTAAAVEDLPASDLDFRPTPEVMSFREIARHILIASDGMIGMLVSGEDNFATSDFRERMVRHARPLSEAAGAAELAGALRESAAHRIAELAAMPPDFFSAMMTRFDRQQVTRLEMLQLLKEHELTHRQQLFLYLRLKGIVPATTRRRMAQQAGR